MAPGFFGKLWDKVKDVGKKVWSGIQKAVPVVKKVWETVSPVVKPLLSAGGSALGIPPAATHAALTTGETLLGTADRIINKENNPLRSLTAGAESPFSLMKSRWG